MYGCEGWTIKKTKHERIGAFELWCWKRPFRAPCTVKRSHQSILSSVLFSSIAVTSDSLWPHGLQPILEEINREYSLEALMLRAEASILRPPDAKSQLIEKDPDAEKDQGWEEKVATEDEMVGWHHWPNGHDFEKTLRDSEVQGSLACYSSWNHKSWTQLSDWTTTTTKQIGNYKVQNDSR